MQLIANKPLFSRITTTLLMASFLVLAACAGSDGASLPDDPTQEQYSNAEPGQVPPDNSENLSDAQRSAILQKYNHIDPTRTVRTSLLERALVYFDANKSSFKNQRYISVIDFAKSSMEPRFYIINMQSGAVWAIRVAHGAGSDSDHDGYAEKFSNKSGAHASSVGFYRTAETYTGSKGFSLRLDGLSPTNSLARARAVVIHGADYVQDTNIKQGRSWGCPAVSRQNLNNVIAYVKGGSLLYADK